MPHRLRYLLLQVRLPEDQMREHEIICFARGLHAEAGQIAVADLLAGVPEPRDINAVDVVLLGGSGDYSVATGGPWLPDALEAMRELHAMSKPTFASCWGFQAMAAAMGGTVVHDLSRAELGTHRVRLTAEGEADPIFGPMGSVFAAQFGHEDIVDTLPDDAVLLASTSVVENEAFCFRDKPIYCTQFHPELNHDTLLDRVRHYPKYVEKISGEPYDAFVRHCYESPATDGLLARFIRHVTGVNI